MKQMDNISHNEFIEVSAFSIGRYKLKSASASPSAILIQLQCLQALDKNFSPFGKEKFYNLANAAFQLHRVIDLLQAHYRLSTGKAVHAVRRVDINCFLETLFQNAAQLLYMDAVDLCFAVPVSRCIVKAEPKWIADIVGQLLSNAVKYRTPGTPIQVRAITSQSRLEIEISNRGETIPPRVCARMFEPYYSTIHAPFDSPALGLGLTVAREYAALMGGTLTVETERETVFKLVLPLRPIEDKRAVRPVNLRQMRIQLGVILSDVLESVGCWLMTES